MQLKEYNHLIQLKGYFYTISNIKVLFFLSHISESNTIYFTKRCIHLVHVFPVNLNSKIRSLHVPNPHNYCRQAHRMFFSEVS